MIKTEVHPSQLKYNLKKKSNVVKKYTNGLNELIYRGKSVASV